MIIPLLWSLGYAVLLVSSVNNCSCFVGVHSVMCREPIWSGSHFVWPAHDKADGRLYSHARQICQAVWSLLRWSQEDGVYLKPERIHYFVNIYVRIIALPGKLSFSVTDVLSPESSLTLQSFRLLFPKWLASTDMRIIERANKLNPLRNKGREVYACTPYKICSKFWSHHPRKLYVPHCLLIIFDGAKATANFM